MKLPLLEAVMQNCHNTFGQGDILLACQHILPTTGALLEACFRKGLKPENTYVLGEMLFNAS